MSGIPIVIPSMGRPTSVHTHAVFGIDRVEYCVPAAEADAYAASNPGLRIVTHPDSLIGLAAKRQFIYDRYGDVVMIDDDIKSFIHLEHGPGEKTHYLDVDDAVETVERIAENAREFGAFLFGVNSSANPLSYVTAKPFRTTGWVNGGFTGLLAGSKLAYNPRIACMEDFWISGMNAYHHRKCWIDTRYALVDASGNGTMRTTGGMALTRSAKAQANDNRILKATFGDAMRPRRVNNKIGAIHEQQLSFTTPW